jgi:hypothetical protein
MIFGRLVSLEFDLTIVADNSIKLKGQPDLFFYWRNVR